MPDNKNTSSSQKGQNQSSQRKDESQRQSGGHSNQASETKRGGSLHKQ